MRDSKDRGERHSRRILLVPAALVRRAPTVAGEEGGEAERRGGSGSACAVLVCIAISDRDSEWRGNGEGIRGMMEDSMLGARIYKETEIVGSVGFKWALNLPCPLTNHYSLRIRDCTSHIMKIK
jgi:hypothetical protein